MKQQQLKNGVNVTDFIKAWGSPVAINQVPTALTDIVAIAENSVALVDVRRVWGPGAATTIVVSQLKGLFYFSEAGSNDVDVQRKVTQLMETAALIVDEFYFLTMPELCSFFRRVKTGMYGQISWGTLGINVQQLFCAMREFQRDRKIAYDRLEAARQQADSLSRVDAGCVGPLIGGIPAHHERCCKELSYFLSTYPWVRGPNEAEWWEKFKRNQKEAISEIFKLKTIK